MHLLVPDVTELLTGHLPKIWCYKPTMSCTASALFPEMLLFTCSTDWPDLQGGHTL